jgi:hypothetical protein
MRAGLLAALLTATLLAASPAAQAAQPKQIPERVLRTLEAQQRNAPREPKGGKAAGGIREAMDMLPRPDAVTEETARRAEAMVEPLLPSLEELRGRPTSPWQRKQVLGAALELTEKVDALNRRLVESIGDILGLEPKRFALVFPPGKLELRPLEPKTLSKLEEVLGRKLRPSELDAMRAAGQSQQDALKPVTDRFVRQLSVVSGVSDEAILELLSGPEPQRPPAPER